MAVRIVIFNIVQIAACLYALRRGGAPERWVAAMMAAAAASTALLPFNPEHTFVSVDGPQVAVDGTLLLGLLVLAVRADRFWPLWIAALQLVAIVAHGVRAIDAAILPAVYNQAIGKVAYPMILILIAGTYRHRRRCHEGGTEADWSVARWR